MGRVRHGCATTTHAMRAAIQRSQASIAALSQLYGINPKTVMKWRKRGSVEDALQRPAPDDLLDIVAKGSKTDAVAV